MSQSIMERLFGDESFFEDEYLLWPRRCRLSERFLSRREQMMENFRADVGDRLIDHLFQNIDELFSLPSSTTSSSNTSSTTNTSSSSTTRLTGRSVFSLDARGFSPEDVSVTVCGRKLEVKVAKPVDTDSVSPAGLSQSVEIPEDIDPSTLTCSLGDDGFLNIQSEVKEVEAKESDVPVRFRTSLDFPLSNGETGTTEEKND